MVHVIARMIRSTLFICFLTLSVSLFGAQQPAAACDIAFRWYGVADTWGADRPPVIVHPTGERELNAAPAACAKVPGFDLWARMAETIETGGIIVLGEIHDNPEHHKFRATLLERRSAVVMEQLKTDGSARLPVKAVSLDDFKAKTDWADSGWNKYAYDPLLGEIAALSIPVYAGDVPREAIFKAAKEGERGVAEAERKRLALDVPMGEKLDAASAQEIKDSHCGMMPDKAIPKMAFAQRYRDAHLADAALEAAKAHGSAVVLAGNSHARSDRGIAWYIRQRAPDRKVVSVLLVEVEEGKTDPEAHIPRDPDGKPAADFIIFTPTVKDRPDPCEAFKGKHNSPG
jgi:uncharacterized iron-regulated protein